MEFLRAGEAGVQVEQAAGLGDGERDQVTPGFAGYEGRRGVCPARGETLSTGIRPPFERGRPAGAGLRGQEGVREHRQGDVPVPGAVAAYLVVVQAGLVPGLGEAVLDRPPGSGDRDQLGEGEVPGGPAAEVRHLELALLARGQGPADQQVMAGAGGADQRPVVQPGPLGPVRAADSRCHPDAGTRAASSSARNRPAGTVTVSLHATAIT